MKKLFLLISAFTFASVMNAQDADTTKLCCQDVEFYLMTTEASEIDSTSTMIDLSMQQPKLVTIPEEIIAAKNAKFVNVSFNRISVIPESITGMENLQCLDLSGNRCLTTLPLFFNNMPNLKIIKLMDMPEWSNDKKEKIKKQFPKITIIF